MTRNRSGCWTQDPARIFHNMCFIRKARRINETILVSSPPPNADRTTDLSTNGFILPSRGYDTSKSPILLLSILPWVMFYRDGQ